MLKELADIDQLLTTGHATLRGLRWETIHRPDLHTVTLWHGISDSEALAVRHDTATDSYWWEHITRLWDRCDGGRCDSLTEGVRLAAAHLAVHR